MIRSFYREPKRFHNPHEPHQQRYSETAEQCAIILLASEQAPGEDRKKKKKKSASAKLQNSEREKIASLGLSGSLLAGSHFVAFSQWAKKIEAGYGIKISRKNISMNMYVSTNGIRGAFKVYGSKQELKGTKSYFLSKFHRSTKMISRSLHYLKENDLHTRGRRKSKLT